MNMTRALKIHVVDVYVSKKKILKTLVWLSLLTIPVIAHIHLNQTPERGLATIETNQDTALSFLDEHIAYLINQGKTFKQLINIGYSEKEIIGGFQELISSRTPIPTISELQNLGLKDQYIINNAANLIIGENLSVNDLDDMGFKQQGFMPKIIKVFVNHYHYSQDELEGIGFTPTEIKQQNASSQ